MKIAQLGTDAVVLGAVTAATTARTANIDCAGANYATIRVSVGVELNTNSTNVPITLSESDDTQVSNFATFNAVFNRTVDNTAAQIATNHVDLDGRKRYLRLTVTPDATTNGPVVTSAGVTLYKNVIGNAATELGPDVAIG